MSNYCVYAHLKKNTDEVFYIGKGIPSRPAEIKGRSDFWEHVYSKHGRDIKLLHTGLADNTAKALEIFWIAVYGRRNINTGCLVNLTNGGDGMSGYKPTPESIEKTRISNLGNTHAVGNKSNTGRTHSRGFESHVNQLGNKSSKYKGDIVATDELGSTIILTGESSMKAEGFNPRRVYDCVNGRKYKSHRGYTFKRISHTSISNQ